MIDLFLVKFHCVLKNGRPQASELAHLTYRFSLQVLISFSRYRQRIVSPYTVLPNRKNTLLSTWCRA